MRLEVSSKGLELEVGAVRMVIGKQICGWAESAADERCVVCWLMIGVDVTTGPTGALAEQCLVIYMLGSIFV